MKKIVSKVKDHEGLSTPVWLNKNQVCHRFGGITGFFKNIKRFCFIWWKSGKEFHGIIIDGQIYSTEII